MCDVTNAFLDNTSSSAFLIEAYEGLARTVTKAIDKVHRRHIKGGVNDDNLLCELKKQGINNPHLIVEELQNEGRIIKNSKGKYALNKNFGQNDTAAITTAPISSEWVKTSECYETADNEEDVFHRDGSRSDTRERVSEAAKDSTRYDNPYMLVIENVTEEIVFLRSSLDKKDVIIHDLIKSLTVIHNNSDFNVGNEKEEKREKQQKQQEKTKSAYDRIPFDHKTPNPPTKRKSTHRDWEPLDDRQGSPPIDNIRTQNRFSALSKSSESSESDNSVSETSTPKQQQQPKSYKKPTFWNNKTPEKGNFVHSNTELNGEKVTIFSDSMCSGMYGNNLTKRTKCCRVQVKAFNGATSNHLKSFHMIPTLQEQPPNTAIIHVGTNSLRTKRGEAPVSSEDIAHGIIDCALTCKSYGVQNIVVSGICDRRGKFFARRLRDVNDIVEEYCKYYNFIYLDNKDIVFDKHLKDDGLHLNPDGREMLTNKFVNTMQNIYK